MTTDFTYQWRTDVHRNPRQLPDNRKAGREHPPELRWGNVWWNGPEVWFVEVVYGTSRYTADNCATFLDAIAYLDAEHNEWRYVATHGTTWIGERYSGGSGPTAEFHISGRRLSKRTRPYDNGPSQGAG